jgi:rare lipoprotein A
MAVAAVCAPAYAQSLSDAASIWDPPGPVGAWQTAVTPETSAPAQDPLWTAKQVPPAPARVTVASAAAAPARSASSDSVRGPRLTGASHGLTGLASYYARGEITATGERFDPAAMTAAHRTLPFGTRVRVTRVDTGNSVVVRINDRGPFKPNRVIDLSKGAAENLGMTAVGLTPVRLEVLGR